MMLIVHHFSNGLIIHQLILPALSDSTQDYAASSSAIQQLFTLPLTDQQRAHRSDCPICLNPFEKEAKFMPCGHYFHEDCLLTWLQQHHTCPDCRYELDTDNPWFNQSIAKRMQGRRSVNHLIDRLD
jgi:hypothetical protein